MAHPRQFCDSEFAAVRFQEEYFCCAPATYCFLAEFFADCNKNAKNRVTMADD
jgi:hypothetical protein